MLIIPIVVAAVLLYYLFNLAIDCYLMASSTCIRPSDSKNASKAFQATVDALLPEISIPFGWLLRIINILGFIIRVNIGDGVTCEGMQAPCYLAINCMIIAAVILFSIRVCLRCFGLFRRL